MPRKADQIIRRGSPDEHTSRASCPPTQRLSGLALDVEGLDCVECISGLLPVSLRRKLWLGQRWLDIMVTSGTCVFVWLFLRERLAIWCICFFCVGRFSAVALSVSFQKKNLKKTFDCGCGCQLVHMHASAHHGSEHAVGQAQPPRDAEKTRSQRWRTTTRRADILFWCQWKKHPMTFVVRSV